MSTNMTAGTKNANFLLKFELRKKSKTLFFDGIKKGTAKATPWVEAMGKCEFNDKPIVSEKEVKLQAKLTAQKIIDEKAKLEAELKAQKLAEEKEKLEDELRKQILEEEKEKLKNELRAKIKAELRANNLSKEKAEQKAKKLAMEKARLAKEKAILKAKKLAKEKVEQKAKKLAMEKARLAKGKAELKAKKLAKEKAIIEAQRKAQNKKDFLEHVNMIKDIELFLNKGSSFDSIKIANLFVKFNGLAQSKWTSNTFKAYRKLKNYALSYNDFKDFIINQELNRENLKNEKINSLSESLRQKIDTLKEFVTKNLTSKKTPRALELISKVEEELSKKEINRLDKLNQEVGDWISNINKKTSIVKKNKPNLDVINEKKSVIKNIETMNQRFNRLKETTNYQQGACLSVITIYFQRGYNLTKNQLAIAQKLSPRYMKLGDAAQVQCRLTPKTAADVDRYLTCLSNKSSPADAEFYAGVKTYDAKALISKFTAGSGVPLDLACGKNGNGIELIKKNNVVKKQKPNTKPNVQNSIAMKSTILNFKKQTAYRCYNSVPSIRKDTVRSILRQGNDYMMKSIDAVNNNNPGLAKSYIDTAGQFYDNSISISQRVGATNC